MKRNILATGLISIVFATLGLYFGNQQAKADAPPTATRDFFATSLPDVKNQQQALAQWKGKALLVNFWATWCNPCVKEMPELSALQAANKNPNIQVIGIGIDTADNIQEFNTKYKISYPLYVAGVGGSELLRKLGDPAGGLPFSILIGPDGQIKKTYLGSLKMDQVKHDLASL
jgi:thiol-disulfide isomerase/thioredoxin